MKFIDLFAGMGGFRLGMERAGAECVFSSEIDAQASDTYAANFGERPSGDITKIDAADIPEHDILVGGFPCQPFSRMSYCGHLRKPMGIEDTRGTLIFDIVRILREKRPRAFILENVPHLKFHDGGRTMRIIEASLREAGYDIHCKVISAKTVVPQDRKRIYIIGFDRPTVFDFPQMPEAPLGVGDVLEEAVDPKYTLSDNTWKYLIRHRIKYGKLNFNGLGFKFLRKFEDPAPTLLAHYARDGREMLIEQEGLNPRKLTPLECRRIMGFPDDYIIPGADSHAYKQLGNAVVPQVIEILGKAVLERLRHPLHRPTLLDYAIVRAPSH